MFEERIDELIETYNDKINQCLGEKEGLKRILIADVNRNANVFIERYARCIACCDDEIAIYESFIELLEYAKTGERTERLHEEHEEDDY